MTRKKFGKEIATAVQYILNKQNSDGSFSCELLQEKSVFYSSLVLDSLCTSKEIFAKHKNQIKKLKSWIINKQYSDGRFEGTNFLVIPNPNMKTWNATENSFTINRYGSGNSITGEVSGLFTTAIASRALRRFSLFAVL